MPIYGQENPLSDRTKPIRGFFPVWDTIFLLRNIIRKRKPWIDGCTAHTRSNIGSHELTALYTYSRGALHRKYLVSDRGRLEPVRPWSIGACPTVVDWSAWSRHLSPRWHSLPMLHVIWIVPLSSRLFIHQVDITKSLFQIPRCSLRLSMFPWRASRVALRMKRLAGPRK